MTKNILINNTKEIRRNILKMIFDTQGSHVGCALGIVDILTILYFKILNVDPRYPIKKDRDRFILSKGHACTALYATLAERGFFSKKLLNTFSKNGSRLAAHVTYGSLPGIEATAGSLGHGLSMGVGMALAAKNDKINSKIYVLTGDGECLEGSIWEAITFAGHHKLDNLIMIIDNNNLITLGKLTDILNLEPLGKKLEDFGWKTITVDGHNLSALEKICKTPHKNQPLAIIAKTIKGKGVSFMENNRIWHGKSPNEQEYKLALEQLK